MSKKTDAQCAKCPLPLPERVCFTPDGKGATFCPTLTHREMAKESFEAIDDEECRLLRTSIQEESASYRPSAANANQPPPYKPRIAEIVGFCQRMGYKRLGLIFCVGSNPEAKIIQEILTINGFEVVSIGCKVGQIPKTQYGVSPDHLIDCTNQLETACNPKLQAMLANEANVDFAILLNLCVGHDSLVIKHLKAPVTVFSVKDRLLGHYPLLAIYQYDGFYSYLKHPLPVCEPVCTPTCMPDDATGNTPADATGNTPADALGKDKNTSNGETV